ncbi:MAG: putative porin [Ginsengibacter sp.]
MIVQHRDDLADSITISFRYLNALKNSYLDSVISDFGRVYSVPADYVTLGNNGNAAFPILFSPILQAGWDPGFHAFDLYKFTLDNTRFFKTTRPFTSLGYFLGSGKEQEVKVLQTQNIKPNWNAGFEYRLINSPGTFQNQNTNDNSYRLFSNYQGKRKRYAAYFVILGNKLTSAENGGIVNNSYLADPNRSRRIAVPVNLGVDSTSTYNVFSSKILTGNSYNNFTAFFRQSYDVGKRDSIIINDSTKEYLFYPKLRFQHTLRYDTYRFRYQDILDNINASELDSGFYKRNYGIQTNPSGGLNFWIQENWKVLSNDFSLRQFPQTKNTGQYIEAGIKLENGSGVFYKYFNPASLLQVFPNPPSKKKFYNVILHGEYRNKTKNKKWDATLNGEFYATGLNAGDFNAQANITRYLKRLGDVQLFFQNVNRSPSFIYSQYSAFDLDSTSLNKKENITLFGFRAGNNKLSLMARNISITNYIYLKDYYHSAQFSGLVNISQIQASKFTSLSRHINLYSDFTIQQTAGKNPIRVPLFYTRQRLAFEGNFYKNLNLSTGIDIAYNTPYKANNYSPIMGKFFAQDSVLISNRPQVNLFFNFRIKSFTVFVKAENLNTVSFDGGLGFLKNNFTAPYYPSPGLLIRFGIQWGFVN